MQIKGIVVKHIEMQISLKLAGTERMSKFKHCYPPLCVIIDFVSHLVSQNAAERKYPKNYFTHNFKKETWCYAVQFFRVQIYFKIPNYLTY